MPLKIVLLTPRRRFIANRSGLGYQIPLGLVLLGGPLADAGHKVRLIDNDARGWSDDRLAEELARDPPDILLIGHTGSTAAHPVAMRTAAHLRRRFPGMTIIYGGVYPTYAAEAILAEYPAVDIVVRGEGEETVVEVAAALANERSSLDRVKGITRRDGNRIAVNPDRPPIGNLDRFRPGWELVDWRDYHLFGFGRSAGIQFSRGCPGKCAYCGQNMFWKNWRHRSPENFVGELETLVRAYGVRIVWFADEDFAVDRNAAREVLEQVIARNLGLSINLNMTVGDILRNADLLPLFKRAGVDNIIIGVETTDEDVGGKIRKRTPFEKSRKAIRLLREHGIVSLVNIMYGMETDHCLGLIRTCRRLKTLDADIVNAVYLTPHHWTGMNTAAVTDRVIQRDQERWTYRNQVLATPSLPPFKLFLSIKATEALYHLRPRGLWRMLFARDARYRRILRAYMFAGINVLQTEVVDFFFHTRFAASGSLKSLPGEPRIGGRGIAVPAEAE